MSEFNLSQNSLDNIENCNDIIKLIVPLVIEYSTVDFGILNTGGFRSAEMQNKIFKEGNSKCDGFVKKSYHQSGNAVDLVPYINGAYTWNNKAAFIAILEAWQKAEIKLRMSFKIPTDIYFHHGIFWNWKDMNKDGIMDINDKLGWDSAHHEIRDKPQKY